MIISSGLRRNCIHTFAGVLCFVFIIPVSFAQNDQNFKIEGVTDCNEMPSEFRSPAEALAVIRTTKFSLSQEVNTTRVSGFRKAHYRSCDMKLGFLLVEVDSTWIIHHSVPVKTWEEYVASRDLQGFYEERIKNKYPRIMD